MQEGQCIERLTNVAPRSERSVKDNIPTCRRGHQLPEVLSQAESAVTLRHSSARVRGRRETRTAADSYLSKGHRRVSIQLRR
jgi:hypothetical protein